tara:strand:+ start:23652 stop:25457 length:1806 start_codon:yes stop_codon:yes gene_type:complete
MSSNPLVAFLASYGPQPSSNNLYDEFVVEAAARTGCAPLEIEQPISARLEAMLRSDRPRSVILTGTAGDGKTYTARKLAEQLSEDRACWGNTDKIFDLPLPGHPGRKIRFIKDLSELNEADKDALFAEVIHSFAGQQGDLFVICVNDGHLLKFFRDRADRGGKLLHDLVTQMLQQDQQQDADKNFHLINMSRQAHQEIVDRIIDAVVHHQDWEKCSGCPVLESDEARCPIRVNLEILRRRDADSMRARLRDMIQMAAADGKHLSIRQLILLTSNILLGDKGGTTALLTCAKAHNRAKKGTYSSTNPYANAFGDNLSAKERQQYGAFSVLSDFGIGFETNNFFDNNLLLDADDLPRDPIYGARVFDTHRRAYSQNPAHHAATFCQEMVDQRRRVFFSVDPEAEIVRADPRRDPWHLTVYQYSASYLRLVDKLSTEGAGAPPEIAESLIRGLNRMMTGEMTTTGTRLWLTEPSGVYLGREIPLLVAEAGREREGLEASISFPRRTGNGIPPVLRFTPRGRPELAEDLVLRPTIFECLMRVANGSLPASFSSEYKQDIARFQLRSAASVREAIKPNIPAPQQIQMNYGELSRRPIAIMTGGDGW